MPSQIADSPLTIEHGTDGPDDNPSEFVNFGDIDGDMLNVVADERGLYLMTSSGLGAQFSTDDATTVAETILKLVAPPAGELALPLLAEGHVEEGATLGQTLTDLMFRSAKDRVLAGRRAPTNEAIFVALSVLAITQARSMGAKTPAEAIAMITTIPGLPGVKYGLADKFSDL